jgi:hypothetical protein|tara:strand:- start:4707 stop:5606 length:900 start_codon:yes stop_codon:yes gene_type:complete
LAHNNHVTDGFNKDVSPLYGMSDALEYYLDLAKDWEDPNPPPRVTIHEGIRVVRDDDLVGSKVRGGDCLISTLPENIDTIVYVQPRTGLAGVSLLDVAKRHGKKVKLFMPSSKRISVHQACCIERGCDYDFYRIAAMPNLNLIAKKWADQNPNAFFVPLGLKHELVTAGFVKVASKIKEPDEVYLATSTGVLTRALQIAWPNAKFTSVCVSRNMKAGELGVAEPISEPLAFQAPEKTHNLPPFPNIATYDGKVWKYIPKNSDKDILFWNVGGEPELLDDSIYDNINSYRDWTKNETAMA